MDDDIFVGFLKCCLLGHGLGDALGKKNKFVGGLGRGSFVGGAAFDYLITFFSSDGGWLLA